MANQLPSTIQKALHLIKKHITEEETEQNRDLHEAVQLIVGFIRSQADDDIDAMIRRGYWKEEI